MKKHVLLLLLIVFVHISYAQEGVNYLWENQEDWKNITNSNSKELNVLEFIPKEEAKGDWSQKITIISLLGKTKGDLVALQRGVFDNFKSDYPDSEFTVLEKKIDTECPWVLFTVESKDKKNPKAQLWHILQGKENVFMCHITIKKKILNKSFIDKWSSDFKNSKLIHKEKSKSLEEKIATKILTALEEQERGDYDKSIEIFDEILETYGEIPYIYILKSEAYMKGKRSLMSNDSLYTLALYNIDKAIELDSTMLEAHRSRALTNLFFQKYNLAITDYDNVLKYATKKEDVFSTYADRGSAKLYLKDFDGGAEDYRKALDIKPDDRALYINTATLYSMQAKYDKAIELYKIGLEKLPNDTDLLNNYGFMYIKMKDFEKALPLFNQAVEADKSNSYAFSNRGYVKMMLGNLEEGKKDIDTGLELDFENSYAYKYRAIYFFKTKEQEKGCSDLEKANELGYSISFDNEVNELIKENCK